jgi:hypothetical protein
VNPFEFLISITPFVFAAFTVKTVLEHRRARLELERGKGADPKLLEAGARERKLLVERIEHLETIVCSVDLELNQKLSRLIDEQQLLPAPAGATSAPAPAGGPARAGDAPAAAAAAPVAAPAAPGLDRTLTAAPGASPAPRGAGSTELHPGEVLAGRYRVQRLLGRGGMGAVYLADDEVLRELVALKVIASAWAVDDVAMIARFKGEATAARKVSSPNVIRIHDLGEARPGLLYLSMEYFPGRTLAEVITQRGLVPLADARDYLRQICTGLGAAHDAGVIHRDLKPQNVLVGERGAVKLIDFGLAKAASGHGLTSTGALLGTPNYMAPEQLRGKAVDVRTDLYALGALAFHLLTGRPPFAGDNPIAVGFAHLTEPPPTVRSLRPDVDAALEQMVLAALAKDPAQRPASAADFRKAVEAA